MGKELLEYAAKQLDVCERMMVAQMQTIAALIAKLGGEVILTAEEIENADPKLIDAEDDKINRIVTMKLKPSPTRETEPETESQPERDILRYESFEGQNEGG